jgi:hypothetical protein
MPDPLAFLSLALAAGGGQIDGQPARACVAAGHALLQRSAPLVRALSGRRSAILLPPGGAFLTALAASDGRGAVLASPSLHRSKRGEFCALTLEIERIGAVFTSRSMADCVPPQVPVVYLDDSPRTAMVCSDGQERLIDLGSHFGLDLVGDVNAPGSPEECLSIGGRWLSHRDLLAAARGAAPGGEHAAAGDVPIAADWSLPALTRFAAVLLQGGRLVTPTGGG